MSIPEITLYLDRPGTRCGSRAGSTERGICLACVTKEVTEMAPDPQQMSLTTEMVELDDAERMERGVRLANLCREQLVMAQEHADRRKAMKEEREALEGEIRLCSDIVRTGQEERPKGISR